MNIRPLSATAALGLALLALLAAGCGDDDDTATAVTEPAGAAGTSGKTTTGERSGPKPAKCVRGWNAGANSAAQKRLLGVFADGGAGNVIVGSEDGACVLAAYNVNRPTYLVFTRSGNVFARTGKGPGDEFNDYRTTINPLDVILQSSGKVKLVPQ